MTLVVQNGSIKIPTNVLNRLKVTNNDEVIVTFKDSKIIIEKPKKNCIRCDISIGLVKIDNNIYMCKHCIDLIVKIKENMEKRFKT
jgi:bifunctional DNA-binding transcriptional regulator/antitoxin component of YhaV-PrlF toxin-antitoxin module